MTTITKTYFVFLWVLLSCTFSTAQPYYNTNVNDSLVKKNPYLHQKKNFNTPPTFEESKNKIPQPFWKNNPEAIKSYWAAWEIAFSNLKPIQNNNGFISPYIDPAFNSNIFMWDCSFMTMFGKYGSRAFNFIETLDNFYTKQHSDGFICREIRGTNGSDVFAKHDPSSTGPNIMPWAEWEYYQNTGDKLRLKKVFPVLLAYFNWYQKNRRWPDGTYFSTGWGCGMDNQHRMHKHYNQEWDHGFMSWIDTTLQEILAGSILIKMSKELDQQSLTSQLKKDRIELINFVNKHMWDNQENFYFDKYKDGQLSTVKSIASFWALLANVVPDNKLEKFVSHLSNKDEFARKHRVPTLSASDPNYDPEGGYWNGSVWAPTNYMVLKGLTHTKQDSLAFEIGYNHVKNVTEVFSKTNDFNENYAPDFIQGNDRSKFVGWTGLAPINVLLEYVFGIRPNVPQNTLVIDVNLLDEYGIKNYPFGENGMIDIHVHNRISKTQKPKVTITSNISLKVMLKWNNQFLTREINKGKSKF